MTPVCARCGLQLIPEHLGGLCPRCLAKNLISTRQSALSADDRIGDYELISELGRGGMGVVYLAKQTTLDRLVALKVLARSPLQDEALEQRFVTEARLAAQLQHPNIVKIFETGKQDHAVFYSMELIEGEDLSEYQRHHKPNTRQLVEIVAKAARAVQYAHETGLIHRDVKPSNILIDEQGEPHLTDFGLAVAVDAPGWLTQTGQVLGSPSFMAPEQLAGNATRQSDVYALGAVLYLLLTGRPPLVASKLPDLLKAIESTEPASPKRLDASIPSDLSTIAIYALNKSPDARYQSAAAFAEDLEAWLVGRPIRARPISFLSKAIFWSKRNRALASSLAGAALIALAGAAAVGWEWHKTQVLSEAREIDLYAASLKIASDALARGDLGVAQERLKECPPELRDAAWGLLKARSTGDQVGVVGEQSQTVVDLAISPDGHTVAAASQISCIKLLNTESQTGQSLPGTEFSWSVAFTPDGRFLISADTKVKEWDLKTATVIRTWPGMSAALSPDGKRIATCMGHRFLYEGEPGAVAIWDRDSGEKIASIDEPSRIIRWSHDGRFLLIGDAQSKLSIHDGATGAPVGSTWSSAGPFWSIGFSPDDNHIFASGWSRDVRIWSRVNLEQAPQRLSQPLGSWTAAYSPDGKTLAVACSDRCVYLWDAASGSLRKTVRGHKDEVWSLAWENNQRLISSGRDPRILEWDATTTSPRKTILHEHAGYRPAWIPDGKLMVVRNVGDRRAARIVDLSSGQVLDEIPEGAPAFFDPLRSAAWVWTEKYGLRRINHASPAKEATDASIDFEAQPDMDDLPRLLPAIDRAWAPSHGGGIMFWQLSTGKLLARWDHCFDPPLRAGAMSPDGRYFAWGNHSANLLLEDLQTRRRDELKGHLYEIDSVAFSPDSKQLLSAGVEGRLILWDVSTRTKTALLGTHPTSAGTVAFSPDGKIVAALEPGLGIHLWHMASRDDVDFIPIPNQETNEWLDFSPDGRWLATRSNEGKIHVFPIITR